MNRYLDGLRFGMLLQLAVGPMCLLVFNTAKNLGFVHALYLVGSIVLVDALYIYLAGIGASRILMREWVKNTVHVVGAFILCLFGINMILEAVGTDVISSFSVSGDAPTIFMQGIILTLSNPMTIVFWGTILTKKIIEEQFERNDLISFSVGSVSATIIFLSGIALLGTVMREFLPTFLSNGMNIAVGMVIVYFGIKMFQRR